MIAEAFVPSFGSLGIGGVVAFVIGAVILLDTDTPGFGIPYALVGGVAVLSAALMAATGALALRARRRPVVSGREEMIGSAGEVLQAEGRGGWARVHSERWQVVSAAPLAPGQRIRVTGIDGLTLRVEPVDAKGD
jgi:membrane-bound serine protease (ClpP class)